MRRGGRHNFDERVVKLVKALAMFGGKGDRVAEAEAEGLIAAVAPGPLGLVGDDDGRLAGAAHGLREMPVGGGDPGARVDEEENGVAVEERRFRLRAHAARQRVRVALLEPGRVDDGEGEIGDPALALAPVTGDAGLIVDKSELLPTSRLNRVDLPTFGRPMIATLLMVQLPFSPCGRRREAPDEGSAPSGAS